MNDDALKKLWLEQALPPSPALSDKAQIAALKRMKCFDTTITRRDYGEVVACLIIILYFGRDLFFRNNPVITQAGCVVLILGAVFIAVKLIGSKLRLPRAQPDAPVLEGVKIDLLKVENQIRLLRSIAWWYLLPLFVGVMLYHWGSSPGVASGLGFLAFILLIYGFIYWLNQRAVKTNLLPLKRELERVIHSTETGEPIDENQIPILRSYELAMRAATQVKVAEFKVAFWQLAIYGVPGIVGIWFFMTIARTQGNIAEFLLPQHLLWGAASFLGGLIYTWLIQKTAKRAVGISPLGVHLQNGMNLIRWDEIREVRPFRFLNIRNLWLIKESGEKSPMHWSPLERHSDLKAAVERFAPADHPIREHLSLLRTKSTKKHISYTGRH